MKLDSNDINIQLGSNLDQSQVKSPRVSPFRVGADGTVPC